MTSVPFVPREYQIIAKNWIIEKPRCALFLGMGLGKTAAVLSAALEISKTERVFPILIIAPLRVAKKTWPDEILKWSDFNHLKVSVICGNEDQRHEAASARAHVYTINYENLPWLVEYYGKRWPFRFVVADELTRLKSFRLRQGGSRARALGRIAHTGINRFIGLTGTPSPNGVKDLWGQMWFLDKGQRLGLTFTKFEQRWFSKGYDGFSLVPFPYSAEEIQTLISDLCLSIRTQDYLNIKEPIHNKIFITLDDKVRKIYQKMENEMYTIIENVGVEAANAAVVTSKCLQIAQGFLYHDDKSVSLIHKEKLDALEDVVEELNGANLLVVYNFKADLEAIKKKFPKAVALTKDPRIIDNWNAGKIQMLLVHPQSAGHGLSLQHGGNNLVFYGHNWNLEEYEQVIERIGPVRQLQSGYDRPVYVHHIIAKDTIEEDVIERLETKASAQEILLRSLDRSKKSIDK